MSIENIIISMFCHKSFVYLSPLECTRMSREETNKLRFVIALITEFARCYQAGFISIEELVNELQYARGITFQYYFGTTIALSKLKVL